MIPSADLGPELSLKTGRSLVDAADALVRRSIQYTRKQSGGAGGIDNFQVICERVAYAATEARAASELLDMAERTTDAGSDAVISSHLAIAGIGELIAKMYHRLDTLALDIGLSDQDFSETFSDEVRHYLRATNGEMFLRTIGEAVINSRGRNDCSLDDTLEQVRSSVRDFADSEIVPLAELIHREDRLIPEDLISKMASLGYFGMSVPEKYGGFEMGMLAMVLTTEELSRGSLAGAGSLITRPEILVNALMKGGTEDQQAYWLPRIASGELMVAISVTEPDVGSDVASLKCRAVRSSLNGDDGWCIQGPKAWCTFAGRADIIALLARTDPNPNSGAKGLSLFIVPKDRFLGHDFEMRQRNGGRILGKADATPGYRGMHSFTLNFEDYFVPEDHLVGGDEGIGKGFYLQMAGFAVGRLQTGGRACGLAQAALERTSEYVADRIQFGKATRDFQLTQYLIGQMAAKLAGARALTYAAAREMEEDERRAALIAAQAKLLACDVALEVSQQGQILHGGWGYAEEYPISRYVADAAVLPIFEGVKPVLELKVIARNLLTLEM